MRKDTSHERQDAEFVVGDVSFCFVFFFCQDIRYNAGAHYKV